MSLSIFAKTVLVAFTLLLTSLGAIPLAYAQQGRGDPPPRAQDRDGPPHKPDLSSLGIDAKTASTVEQVLREHREKMEALRQETDKKLSKLLTEEQIRKLHQAMPRPPHEARQDNNNPPPQRRY